MKTLWIMEGECSSIDTLLVPQTEIHLLPLTSNGAEVEKWEQAARAYGLSFRILDAGRALVVETENLRLQLGKWASAMDRGTEGEVPLRERFMFPEGGVSGWWFSLLSERNPLKTDVFLRIAQLQVVERLVASGVYGHVVHTGLRGDFRIAVRLLCQRHGIADHAGKSPNVSPLGVREQLRRHIDISGVIGDGILAIGRLVRFWGRGHLFRGHLGPAKKRSPKKGALLFAGVFPMVDSVQAAKGIHESRFFGPLQKAALESGLPVTWLFLWIPSQGWSLGQAAKLAKTFVEKGESLYLLEEFLTPSVLFQCLRTWVWSCWRYLTLVLKGEGSELSAGVLLPESSFLLSPLWRASFVGNIAMAGIVSYYCFRSALKWVGVSSSQLIYHAEMQSWEKALNAAKVEICPTLTSIGFQHTAVPPQFFSYFPSLEETLRTGRPSDFPLPDVLACNGEIPRKTLSTSGYPRLEIVEALRHLPLSRVLREPIPEKVDPWALLLVGSIDVRETLSLARLLESAFPMGCPFPLWFKPHPAMGSGHGSVKLDESLRRLSAQIRGEAMDPLLRQSAAILVGYSSLTVEALAYGCRVIIPNRADVLPINALEGRDDLCERPTTSQELRFLLEGLKAGGTSPLYAERGRDFVREYWALEEDLPRWRKLLGLPPSLASIFQDLRRAS